MSLSKLSPVPALRRFANSSSRSLSDMEHYSRFRDRVQTAASTALRHSGRVLWYVEALVLSARYQQWLAIQEWSKDSRRFGDRVTLWLEAAEPRLRQMHSVVLEFGVADGDATFWWSRRRVPFLAWHGFDTFTGLPSAWTRAGIPVMSAGTFTPTTGLLNAPNPDAGYAFTWHKGLIEETLPAFSRPAEPLFVMLDVDLFQPAQTVLTWLIANGRPGDLLYLDEALDPWNEGLALRNALNSGLSIRAIGHTANALLAEIV